jgi:plastocyanin
MSKPLVLGLAAVSLCVVAAALPAAASGPDAGPSATKRVTVGDDFFRQKTVTINSGDTVRWRWAGRNRHNVTVTRGPREFQSSTKSSGRYSKTLRRRGTYRYICTVHAPSMRGKVVVE